MESIRIKYRLMFISRNTGWEALSTTKDAPNLIGCGVDGAYKGLKWEYLISCLESRKKKAKQKV